MVSTNHFRNRRLTRNRAVVLRQPCDCPTPIPPPTLIGIGSLSWFCNFDDGVNFYTIALRADYWNNGDNHNALINGLCDDAVTPWQMAINVDQPSHNWQANLFVDPGGGFQHVAVCAAGDYIGQDPYTSPPLTFAGVLYNVSSSDVTLQSANNFGA